MQKILNLIIVPILLFPLLLASCKQSENSEIDALKLQTSLILRDEFSQESDDYVQGENIEFYISLTNITNNEVRLNFNDGQQYDFYISSSNNTEIWRWSDNKGFTLALTELVIPAGETIVVSEIWNQVIAGGDEIPIGSYTAYGSFLEQSPEAKFSFSIQ